MHNMQSTEGEFDFKQFGRTTSITVTTISLLWYGFFLYTNQVYTGHLTPQMYMQ